MNPTSKSSGLLLTGYVNDGCVPRACFEENGCRILLDPEKTMIVINVEKIENSSKHCDAIAIYRIEDGVLEAFFIEIKCIVKTYEGLYSDIYEKAVESEKSFKQGLENSSLFGGCKIQKYFVIVLKDELLQDIGHLLKRQETLKLLKKHPLMVLYKKMFVKRSGSTMKSPSDFDHCIF